MQFSGPLPISSPNPVQTQDLNLRLNQRFTAEVTEVAGTKVVLSVGGTPIVARLASADQGAQISGRRVAQFIVTSLSAGEVELKLVEPTQAAPDAGQQKALSGVAAGILQQLGLELDEPNQMLARAMLSQHLAISPALFAELKTFLDGLGSWGENEARLAAAMKAAGLPLSAGVLKFALSPQLPLGETAADLAAYLNAAASRKDLPPEMRDAIQKSQAVLDKMILNWGGSGQLDPADIRLSTQVFGRSLENILAGHMQKGEPLSAEGNLLALARLFQLSKNQNETALAGKVQDFLETAQQYHLSNIRLDPVPGQGEWCELQFVLQNPAGQPPQNFPAQVRVARNESRTDGAVDSSSTRLLIQVDIDRDESIQVDLTFVGKRALAKVTTPNEEMQQRSREEMPELITNLQQLGYQIIGAGFAVGQPENNGRSNGRDFIPVLPLSEVANRRVNIKV